MIIALFGPPGAGKDTVGKILVEQYAYRRVAFADKVRELALRVCGHNVIDFSISRIWTLEECVRVHGWEIAKRESPRVRDILERVGDGCRGVLGEDVWIDRAFQGINETSEIVVTDMRKLNEWDFVRWHAEVNGLHAVAWYITRSGCEKRPFDEWNPDWATATIENNRTVEELAAKVRELMNG